MKNTKDSGSGTSFFGDYINSSLIEMRKLLGEDRPYGGDTRHEWVMETSGGEIVTFYDWRLQREITDLEKVAWHIGAKNKQASLDAKQEMDALLFEARRGKGCV